MGYLRPWNERNGFGGVIVARAEEMISNDFDLLFGRGTVPPSIMAAVPGSLTFLTHTYTS